MPALDLRIETPSGTARVVSTDQGDGDFAVALGPMDLDRRRRAVVDAPWTWLRQVHGTEVVIVDEPGGGAGHEGDAVVTTSPGAPIAVTTADCAPVVLVGSNAIAVVHAGWRGLLAGVIDRAADRLAEVGAAPIGTVLGPCIGPECYEFGPADLDTVANRFGPGVRATTDAGTPALDVPAAVGVACEQLGWPRPTRPPCTSGSRFYSHRVRRDLGRQTTVAWLER